MAWDAAVMSPQTGRRLDDDGDPIPDTGFEYDADGPLAAHLHDRATPLRHRRGAPVIGLNVHFVRISLPARVMRRI